MSLGHTGTPSDTEIFLEQRKGRMDTEWTTREGKENKVKRK